MAISTDLNTLAGRIAEQLRERGETLALCETAAGGLMSAALLAQPGASAWFIGGAVAYSRASRRAMLGLQASDVADLEPLSDAMGLAFAERTRTHLGADWGLAELGIAGPGPSPYGGASGVAIVAVSGPASNSQRLETGTDDRPSNMGRFAAAGLALLTDTLAELTASC